MARQNVKWQSTDEFTHHDAIPDLPAGTRLEAFCAYIGRIFDNERWMLVAPNAFVEIMAQEFRDFFNLSTPVRPRLPGLLAEVDVALTRHAEARSGFDGDAANGWQIALPDNLAMRESIVLLRELFHIFFWRCCYRLRWWPDWMARMGIVSPARLADAFAYLVVLPPDELKAQAAGCGLNVWHLADRFLATPSACFYGLRRYARYDVPYFLARLNFAIDMDQQQLFFEAGSVRAKVWAKFLARARGEEIAPDMEPLTRFPRQGTVVEVTGWLYQTIKTRQPAIVTTDRLLGLCLPRPLCFAARPNPAGTQLLLAAVPVGSQTLLLDAPLRAPQTERRAA